MTQSPLFSHLLEPETNNKFSTLCADAQGDFTACLLTEVAEHVSQVRLALRVNEFLDVRTAEKIASILTDLLGKIETYPMEKQRLIIGAARYFVKNNDARADLDSLLGFDDDVEVLNYVLGELGQSELRIKL